MRAILIDTNAYVALMRGEHEIVEVFARANRLCLNSIVRQDYSQAAWRSTAARPTRLRDRSMSGKQRS